MPDPKPLPPAARAAILDWYARRGRALPFRATSDPYAILVSEAMAQQTQAARAGEAWTGFMDAYPSVLALAAATPADVLRAWRGLGYNRRALNLWRAARRIVDVHGGRVPADIASLQALPGVGQYTARAVAALAFGTPVGAVDTNVRRVLGRMVAGDGPVPGAVAMQRLADASVPADCPGAWTHALMDIGATLCRPRRPDCADCPAQAWCRYAGSQIPTDSGGQPVETARAIPATATREAPAAFATTSRWLRGRIVDQLRSATGGSWTVLTAPIGDHGHAAIAAALEALARDGLVELDDGAPTAAGQRARLPLT